MPPGWRTGGLFEPGGFFQNLGLYGGLFEYRYLRYTNIVKYILTFFFVCCGIQPATTKARYRMHTEHVNRKPSTIKRGQAWTQTSKILNTIPNPTFFFWRHLALCSVTNIQSRLHAYFHQSTSSHVWVTGASTVPFSKISKSWKCQLFTFRLTSCWMVHFAPPSLTFGCNEL